MHTIIDKKTGEEFYGRIVQQPQFKNTIYIDGSRLKHWVFETQCDGKNVVWDCHSDYWELVNKDMRKVKKVLQIENEKSGILGVVKNILKRGFC